MARRGRVGRTAPRREEVWRRGGVRVNSSPAPAPRGFWRGWGARVAVAPVGGDPEGAVSEGGAATGCSSLGMWFADSADPSA